MNRMLCGMHCALCYAPMITVRARQAMHQLICPFTELGCGLLKESR